jgi:hypothetical protein
VHDDPCRSALVLEDLEAVVPRLAAVDDQGAIVLLGDLDVRPEARLLLGRGGVVAVVVEPGLADGDDHVLPCEAVDDLEDVRGRLHRVVGVDPDAGVDALEPRGGADGLGRGRHVGPDGDHRGDPGRPRSLDLLGRRETVVVVEVTVGVDVRHRSFVPRSGAGGSAEVGRDPAGPGRSRTRRGGTRTARHIGRAVQGSYHPAHPRVPDPADRDDRDRLCADRAHRRAAVGRRADRGIPPTGRWDRTRFIVGAAGLGQRTTSASVTSPGSRLRLGPSPVT